MIAAPKRRPPGRIRVTTLATVLGALVVPPVASADDPPVPPADPGAAVSQYRESIPGATGSILPGRGAQTRVRLLPSVSQRLASEGGRDAGLLRRIATSPDYGAPQPSAPRGQRVTGTALPPAESKSAPQAVMSAVGHGGWRIFGLGLFMLVTAASVLAGGSRRGQRAAPQA